MSLLNSPSSGDIKMGGYCYTSNERVTFPTETNEHTDEAFELEKASKNRSR